MARIPIRGRAAVTAAAALLVALLVALLLPATSRAQSAGDQQQTVSVAGGWTQLKAPLSDSLNNGAHAMASLTFLWVQERVGLRFDALYSQMEHKSRDHQQGMVAFSANVELNPLGGGTGPYVVGGYGSYQSLKSGTTPATGYTWGYNVGAGLRLELLHFTIFGETRLHQYGAPQGGGNLRIMPISLGIRV